MDIITEMINTFGPWAVVVLALIWCSQFITSQLDKAQAERQDLQNRHTEEMGKMTEVIQNNTLAVQQLVTLITDGRDANG